MLYLITGGSGSGKSAYAEATVKELNNTNRACYYIATMNPSDDLETQARIWRHRQMRKDSGMQTIECPVCIAGIDVSKDSCVFLLECMSNLLANEMFMPKGKIGYTEDIKVLEERVETEILQPVKQWVLQGIDVVIVSNEVFSDGNTYDIETSKYVELLGFINQKLGEVADKVVEVVCGIPVFMKG